MLRFLRKGIVGSYEQDMPADMIDRFDAKTKQFNEENGINILL